MTGELPHRCLLEILLSANRAAGRRDQNCAEEIEPQCVRAIRQRLLRIIVHLDEDSGDTHRSRGAGQRLDELRLPPDALPAAPGSWTLCVASKTTGQPESRMILQAAHVHHQVVVAERRAALGQHDLRVAGGRHLFGGVVDIVRGDELPLLDVDDSAGAPGGEQQVGLAAEKGGDLQDVGDLGGRLGLRRLVNIGQDREACSLRTPARMRSPSLKPGPAVGASAGAVGFVERRFEDERADDLANRLRHAVDVLFAFDDARAGDQNQRRRIREQSRR